MLMRVTMALGIVALAAAGPADVPAKENIIFGYDTPESVDKWEVTTDSVMGGASKASLEVSDRGTLVFSGDLSLANNGGFALAQSKAKDATLKLDDAAGLVVRIKTDARPYKLTVRLDGKPDSPIYQAVFESPRNEWAVVRVPFGVFKANLRGQPVPDAPAVKAEAVRSIGLLIADKQAGPFRVECDWIGVYQAAPE